MKQFSIQQYVLSLTLIPTLIIAVSLEAYILHDRANLLDNDLMERGKLVARQLASGSEYGVFSNNQAFLQNLAQGALQQPDVHGVTILNAASEILIGLENPGGKAVSSELTREARGFRAGKWVNLQAPVFSNGKSLWVYQPIIPVKLALDELDVQQAVQQAGAVIIEMDWAGTQRQKRNMYWVALGAMTLLLSLSSLLIYLASRRITSPVRKLSEAVQRIGHGHLETRVPVTCHIAELSSMAQGVNAMAYAVQSNSEALRANNLALEDRVAQRTALLDDKNAQITKSLSLLQATLEATHDAILVVDLNNSWVLHNQHFVDLWHIPDEIVATGDDSAALSYVLDQLDDPEGFMNRVRELYLAPETISLDVINCKDGRVLERYSRPQYIDTKVVGRVWSFRDITERQRIQDSLRNSEEKYRILLDESKDPIFSFYPDGEYRYVNKAFARNMGLKAEDIIGKKIWDIFPKAEADQRFSTVKWVFENGVSKEIEVHVPTPDGDLYFLTTANPVLDAQCQVISVICASKNITERKRMEEDLREAKEKAEASTRLKEQFVTLISHDLRSPLLSIKGMLDLVKAESPEGLLKMGQNQTFDRIAQSAEGLINLTERLLDRSRLQAGDIKPEMRLFKIRLLAEEQIGRISHLASVKNITIRNALPESMHIHADPDLYGVVIHNLLSNAIKFTQHGGQIDVFSKDGETIVVRDNGIGIDKKILPDLFDSEVKTTSHGTDGEKGTGLGLPYSLNIIKAHGGSLKAVPLEEGGTEFYVTLPRHDTVIFIIDDQDILRELMREMLARLGDVQVVEARNGAEALEALEHIIPAVIITDIQMPAMDGFELVRRIRGMSQYEMVPIIAVTAFSGIDSGELRERITALGADDFFTKPLVENELLPVIMRYLGIA